MERNLLLNGRSHGNPEKNKGPVYTSPIPFAKRSDLFDQFYIHCVQAFLAILYIKLYPIIFLDLINQSAGVYESFFAAIIMLNESKAFVDIEELDSARCFCAHY